MKIIKRRSGNSDTSCLYQVASQSQSQSFMIDSPATIPENIYCTNPHVNVSGDDQATTALQAVTCIHLSLTSTSMDTKNCDFRLIF
jgi:4-hydroxy-3-methylbut-2-enyl diphosphate reductase IspH